MSEPKLLTIVLNYRTAAMTLRSTETALAAMAGVDGEIIIVDNDSQDGSFETISEHVAARGWGENNRVRVIQSGHNGGFGAGNNIGIRAGLSDSSKPDFIYVLNSDAFPEPDAIKILLDHLMSNPEAGFAGSHIRGDDGVTHTSTFRFPSIFSEFEGSVKLGPFSRLLGAYRVPIETPKETQSVDWLAGASLMMRQSVLDEVGLFDETFFLYFEEIDLCRRVRLAGHRIDFVRASKVTHIGSVSTGMKTWKRIPGYWYDSRLYYFRKNHGAFYAGMATLAHMTGGGLHWLRCLLTGKKRDIPANFLRSLARHDLAAMLRQPSPTARRDAETTQPQPGE